jgi:hypothetical protein
MRLCPEEIAENRQDKARKDTEHKTERILASRSLTLSQGLAALRADEVLALRDGKQLLAVGLMTKAEVETLTGKRLHKSPSRN